MSRVPDREWDPATTFEWFEFDGEPTGEEQVAALSAIARCIGEEFDNCSAPVWSGLVTAERTASGSAASRWISTIPGRQAPVPAWLRRPSPHQRP
ncbi:MAG: hypothetical protein WD602_09015 [Actinomycetota bacterium]